MPHPLYQWFRSRFFKGYFIAIVNHPQHKAITKITKMWIKKYAEEQTFSRENEVKNIGIIWGDCYFNIYINLYRSLFIYHYTYGYS